MVLAGFKSYSAEDQIKAEAAVDSWLEGNYDIVISSFAEDLTNSLDEKHLEFVKELQSELDGFHKRLFDAWSVPLTRFGSLIAMCMEMGDQINREYRDSEKYPPSSRRNATTRIHARAVQVANEVSCLVRGGYADGAMARWRSLHEASVILVFLSQNDEELSNRFMDHQAIIRFKAATEYNEHHSALGFSAFDVGELAQMQKSHDEMLAKYGKHFSNDYGWASEVTKSKRPHFKDIENNVSLGFLRPQYGFASKNVHSGVDSIGYKLALSMTQEDILLAGPSNEGFIDPVQCASYSLIIATGALIDTSPDDERTIMESVLWRWHELLKLELIEAKSALRSRGETNRDK